MHFRARSYDPRTGRFIEREPRHRLLQQGFNYALNNPVSVTDPRGTIAQVESSPIAASPKETKNGRVLYGGLHIQVTATKIESPEILADLAFEILNESGSAMTYASFETTTLKKLLQQANNPPDFDNGLGWAVSGGKSTPSFEGNTGRKDRASRIKYEFDLYLENKRGMFRVNEGRLDWTEDQRLSVHIPNRLTELFLRPISFEEKKEIIKITQDAIESVAIDVRDAAIRRLRFLAGNREAAQLIEDALRQGNLSPEARVGLEEAVVEGKRAPRRTFQSKEVVVPKSPAIE